MKERWLYLGLIAFIAGYLPSIRLRFILFLLLIVWNYYCKKIKWQYFIIFLSLLAILPITVSSKLSDLNHAVVKEAKSKYVIAEVDHQDVIIYSKVPLFEKDEVVLKGKGSEIQSLSNFYGYNFKEWCRKRQISVSYNDADIIRIDQKNTFKRNLYNRVMNLTNKKVQTWMNQVLFGIDMEDDGLQMIHASGMHYSLLFFWLKRLLCLFVCEQMASSIQLLAAFLFCRSFAFSFSMKRIICTYAVYYFFSDYSKKDKLGISVLLILFLYPYAIYELSFLLSFLYQLINQFDCSRLSMKIKSILIMIPIQCCTFYCCNLISVLLFPIYRIYFTIGSLLAFFVAFFSSFTWLADIYIDVLAFFIWIEKHAIMIRGKPSLIWLVCYSILIIKLLSDKSLKTVKMIAVLFVMLYFKPYINPFYEVMFINVGQGDAILIQSPFNAANILIDCPKNQYNNLPKRTIQPILNAKGIRHLDYFIMTHDDLDHSNIDELSEIIEIKNVVTDKETIHTLFFDLEILLRDIRYTEKNDNSLIYYTEINGLKYLFMGDASITVEKDLVEQYPKLTTDVLKAGHHGSKTSSSPIFIQKTDPGLVFLSYGKNNRYGHPNEEVLDILEQYQIPYFSSAEDGALLIKGLFKINLIKTSENKYQFVFSQD